ncbi:MAG: hypothetical protein ACREME_10290 [Gemmatimonadales bacterium]
MMRLPLRGASLLLAAAAGPLTAVAQTAGMAARGGVILESYSFGGGLAFDRIHELTIPLVVTQRLGPRLVVDLATAYASASVRDASGNSIDHAGFIDTDVRAVVAVVPGRLVLTMVGTLPTGASAVADTTIPLFGATATDLLGFTTSGFGAGGGASAGFASAFRLGATWAIGTGASYRYGAPYTPVRGGGELTPGGEMRARFGIEGPFGGGKYFRGAFVYTTTRANELGGGGSGGQQSVIGDRALAYAGVSLPLGRSHLFVYGWDMRRLRARGAGAPGSVAVPRGNVLALGARLDRPVSPAVTLSPLLEFRHELTGPTGRMALLGYLVRAGTDVRYRLSAAAVLAVQAQLAFGAVRVDGATVAVRGPRVGALIEWAR